MVLSYKICVKNGRLYAFDLKNKLIFVTIDSALISVLYKKVIMSIQFNKVPACYKWAKSS